MTATKTADSNFSFFRTESEMGKLIRAKDWSKTSVGEPSTWPQSLCTIVGMMLENPFGMMICWGKEYTQLYNDGFRPILGTTKHPAALGISASETYAEIWETIEPMFADVMRGNPIRITEFEVPLNRHGYMETCYFDFSYSPIRMENGEIGGLLVTVIENSSKKIAETELKESKDQLQFAIEAAQLGTWEFNPLTNKFTANERLKEWFGLPPQHEIELHHAIDVMAEEDRNRVSASIQKSLDFNSGGIYQEQYSIIHPVTKKETIVRAKGRAWFNDEKVAYRLNGTLEDVTEEVLAQQKSKESEVFNKTILESSPDCVKVLDLNGVITYINENGVCILEGDNKEYFLNRNWLTMWDDETRPTVNNAITEALQGKNSHFEARAKTVKGNIKWWDVIVTPVVDTKGNIVSVLATSRDITESKKAQELIKESEEKFRTLADNMSQLAWMANENGNRYWYNQRWYDYSGTSFEEMKIEGWKKLHHPERMEKVMKKMQHCWDTGEIWEDTVMLKSKEGDFRWFLSRAVPIKDENGKVTRWFGTNTDITEQKDLIEKLNSTVDKLRLYEKVVVNTNDAVLITEAWPIDLPGPRILYVNEALLRHTGYTKEEVIGKTPRMFQGADTDRKELDKMRQALENKVSVKVEVVNYKKNGEAFIVQIEIIPLLDDNGILTNFVSIQKDVTEQVNDNKKLQESEWRFRQLADQAPMWVWMADENVNVLYANRQVLDFIGIADVSKFTGHVWEQVVHPDDIQMVYKAFGEASISHKAFSFEFKVKNAATELYEWFYIKAVPRFESSQFAGFIGTALNIQEQRSTLSLLEYRKALLEAFNESSNDGILLVDTKGAIISYNPRFVEIWNMPQQIVDAKDDKAALDFAMTQLVNPQQFVDRINWLYNHPKETSIDELHFKDERIIERHGYPVVAQDGSYYAWSWTFRDITAIKKATAALKQSEENFRQLSELMPEKVSRTDAEGNAIYYNQSWMDYTGLTFDEMKDWGWGKVVHPDDLDELTKEWTQSLSTGTNFEMEFRLLNKNGDYRWHLCRSNPLKDENGKIKNWLAAVTEIQKIKEEEQRKGEFIKMVSHELKTPVTSIKGYVQLLLSILETEKETSTSAIPVKPTLERIDKQISRLTRLITEMLDLSRLEESKLELKKEKFNLNILVKETIEDILHTTASHTIKLAENFHADVTADKDRIQQVLINFINNAIKYSPGNDCIEISIYSTDNNHVEVSVRDFGIGIAKADHNKIFERFYRVDGKNEKNFSGFGIGLFITKQIIERHKGTISVESVNGQGSTFMFSLPLQLIN
jgi:PAS domain S-box-containing protein